LNEAILVETPGFTISLLSVVLATIDVVAPSFTVTFADLIAEVVVVFPFNFPSANTSNLNDFPVQRSASGITLSSNLIDFPGSTVVVNESISPVCPTLIEVVLEVLSLSVNTI
jgi:hypothetical protein